MSEQKFRTTILAGATKNVAGIEVPPSVIDALGAGQRPRVVIKLNGYSYVSTVGKMGGKHMISLSAEHRKASGLAGGDGVEVCLSIAEGEPTLSIPEELQKSLSDANLTSAFDSAAPSRRKEWVRGVLEAKAPETRDRRMAKIVSELRAADD
jgi:hypothetical protein